jgi:hypothetical protein
MKASVEKEIIFELPGIRGWVLLAWRDRFVVEPGRFQAVDLAPTLTSGLEGEFELHTNISKKKCDNTATFTLKNLL